MNRLSEVKQIYTASVESIAAQQIKSCYEFELSCEFGEMNHRYV